MEQGNAGRVDARTGRKLEEIKIHKENNNVIMSKKGEFLIWNDCHLFHQSILNYGVIFTLAHPAEYTAYKKKSFYFDGEIHKIDFNPSVDW